MCYKYNQTTMLNSTVELITMAASNSLLVFCFFNLLLILTLLLGPTNPNYDDNEDKNDNVYVEEENPSMSFSLQPEDRPASDIVSQTSERRICSFEESNDNNKDEEEDDDDELRRKVEEFIAKVNHGWKEEKLQSRSPTRQR